MRRRERWLVPFFATAIFGCSRAPSPHLASRAAPPETKPYFAPSDDHVAVGCDLRAWDGNFHDSAELVADPELVKRVDELAKVSAVTLRFSYPVVRVTPAWSKARAVFERTSRCEMRALTRHRSAVVRAFVAQEIIDELPKDVDAVAPLLDDDAQVRSWHDGPRNDTVARFVADTLDLQSKETPQILAVFVNGARNPKLDPAIRGRFLERLALKHRVDARSIALGMLLEHEETLQESALKALEDVGTADDIPAIVPFTTTQFGPTDRRIRIAAIAALGAIPSRACVEMLPHLFEDPDVDVRAAAVRAYVRQPDSDEAVVRRLLTRFDWSAKEGLADRGDDFAVTLLEPMWMNAADHESSNPEVELLLTFEFGRKPAHVDLLRRLLGAKGVQIKRWAIYFWGEAHDTESAPRIRSFLHSPDEQTRANAACAAGKLKDRDAISELMKMFATEDYSVADDALKSLVALHVREAIPIVEAREARHDSDPFQSQVALNALRDGTDWPEDE